MSAQILDGGTIAKRILKDLEHRVAGRKIKLAVIQVGHNAVSETYIEKKKEAAKQVGIGFQLFQFPKDILAEELKDQVKKIGNDKQISGMIIQLPLPKFMNQQEVLDVIPIEKDVDVLSSEGFGLFALGRLPILPPTVGAVSLLLQEYGIQIKGKNVVIVGAGRLVGLPLSIWCVREGATVFVVNKYTKNLSSLTKQADILISGVGKAKLIQGDMVKKGAVVIDAGTSIEQGTTRGDVDFESVSQKADFITRVPGGVGPLTVACLLKNLSILSKIQER